MSRLDALANEQFDVLVVGGGITGCGIAREAVLRGLRVALVEKDDFASGTSSRSSRLVHGGVRYLEHGYLHLVFEASAERRRLLRVAPGLVHPLAFTWPVYRGARVARWKVRAGLTLYDMLALFRNVAPHRALSSRGVLAGEPALRHDGLTGGARYFDAATDDARLTLANALDAAAAGAVLRNHVRAESLVHDASGRVVGAVVRDSLGSEQLTVRARTVVSATGPWTNELAAAEQAPAAVRGSKGVHLMVPASRVGNRGACTLVSQVDGRVMFVLPAGEHTIIGTTDTFTSASPDDVRANVHDVEYLLATANFFFPDANLEPDDVISAWAGIRPLTASASRGESSPGSASREHEVSSHAGLVTVTGGKLTTYRVMANDAMKAVMESSGRPFDHRSPTRDRVLRGSLPRPHPTDDDFVRGVMEELALTLGDLLIRRTHVAFDTRDHGVGEASRVAALIAPLLGWTPDDCAREVERYRAEVARIFTIDAT